MDKILNSPKTTVVFIILVAVFGIHVIAQNTERVRFDMTADDLYSLSDGTETILAKMNDEGIKPIEMKLYFSESAGKSLPKFIKQFITYHRYLKALLTEYEVASKGKIEVTFYDPIPDSDDAQDAVDFGLDGKPINQHGDLFFFGLVLQTQTGSRDVIEFLWPSEQETVEYEISKRLHRMIWPTRKRVGVLSSLNVLSDATNPYMAQILAAQGKDPGKSWLSMQLLEESYQVSRIDSGVTELSEDQYDLVLVIHPKDLSEETLWALDDWVVRGGNALIFLDPFSVADRPVQNPQQPWQAMQYKPSSNLSRLLETWGVERVEDEIAADFRLAVKRAMSRRGVAERMLVDLVVDADTAAETLAPGHPIFQGLSNVRLFMAGSLRPTPEPVDGVTLTPLITTTAQGNTLVIEPGFPDGTKLVFNDISNPAKLQDAFVEGTEPVVMAYAVQGKLPTAFPEGIEVDVETSADGADSEQPETMRIEPVPEESRGEASVLVFADVDLIADEIAFQRSFFGTVASNDNYKVLLNAIDYLLGSEELMRVRSKSTIERPFTLFDEIEREAEQETQQRERELRAEIESFQKQLQEKQSGIGSRNAALFQKQLQDEVDQLNARINEANKELREIRKRKRAALEGAENFVRFSTLWTTPTLVLVLGLVLLFRRKQSEWRAKRSVA